MILALSLCRIWNIIIKQILEQNTCNFKIKFFKKNLVDSRTLRNSRYHSLLWHLTVKNTVLGHLSLGNLFLILFLTLTLTLTLTLNGGNFARGQLSRHQRKQALIKNNNNNIAFTGSTLLQNLNLLKIH